MKLMDYETAKLWAQSEAGMNRTPMYVLDTRGKDIRRFTVAAVAFILGDIPMADNSAYRHCIPVLTLFP